MAELDLGKVKVTDAELQALILAQTGGVKFGKDEEGNPGYYKYDESAGADTFVPFSSGGGGGEFYYPSCPCIWSCNSTSGFNTLILMNNTNEFKKIRFKGRLENKGTGSSATSTTTFSFQGYKKMMMGVMASW